MAQPSGTGTHLDEFLARVGPFLDIWRTIDVRWSAINQGGEWRNLFTQARFGWDPGGMPQQGLVQLGERFRAGRFRMPQTEGLGWLRAIAGGSYVAEDTRVRLDYLPRSPAGAPPLTYGWTPMQYDRTGQLANMRSLTQVGLQGYVLLGNGGAAWDLADPEEWTHIQDGLLAFERPFGEIGEFSTSYLGFPEPKTVGHATAFEIVAPFDSTIRGWSIQGESALSGVIAHPPTIDAANLSLAAILRGPDVIDRGQWHLASSAIDSLAPLRTATFELPWRGYSEANLYLMFRRRTLDVLRVLLPAPGTANTRFQSLFAMPLIGDTLASDLANPDSVRDSHRLELLVCWILHLCGFQVMPTGLPEFPAGDVPDILAFDPYSNGVLVVEVTRKDPLADGKLSTLRRRADEMRSRMSAAEVHAVMVVPAREAFLPSEIEEASRLEVTLLGHPDLQSLFGRGQASELSTSVLRSIVERRG